MRNETAFVLVESSRAGSITERDSAAYAVCAAASSAHARFQRIR